MRMEITFRITPIKESRVLSVLERLNAKFNHSSLSSDNFNAIFMSIIVESAKKGNNVMTEISETLSVTSVTVFSVSVLKED